VGGRSCDLLLYREGCNKLKATRFLFAEANRSSGGNEQRKSDRSCERKEAPRIGISERDNYSRGGRDAALDRTALPSYRRWRLRPTGKVTLPRVQQAAHLLDRQRATEGRSKKHETFLARARNNTTEMEGTVL